MSTIESYNPKWYRYWKFPLLPIIYKRPRDSQNARYFDFRWLMLRVYILTAPYLALGFGVNDEGVSIHANLAYLGLNVQIISFPSFVTDFVWKYLTRKGTYEDDSIT